MNSHISEFGNINTLHDLYGQYMNYKHPGLSGLKCMQICILYPEYDLKSNEYVFNPVYAKLANKEELNKWYIDNKLMNKLNRHLINNIIKF